MADKDKFADEIMSDEELDGVAGGGTRQSVGDRDFLTSMGFMEETGNLVFDWARNSPKVDAGWSNAGVTCVTKFGCPDNLYFIDGKEVSRKDAFRHALRKKVIAKTQSIIMILTNGQAVSINQEISAFRK